MIKSTLIQIVIFMMSIFSTSEIAIGNNRTSFHQFPSIFIDDVFEADIELLEINKRGEMYVIITSANREKDYDYAYQIEAVAIVHVNNDCSLYTLIGQYDDKLKQIILNSSESHSIYNGITNFMPVGLAGKLSEDNNKLYCQIAYNGPATLERVKKKRDNQLHRKAAECQSAIDHQPN